MHPAYEEMARELALYQGRPSLAPSPVGDPTAGRGTVANDPDRGTPVEVAQVYRPLTGYRAQLARDRGATSTVVLMPDDVALSEAGNPLIPPRFNYRRSRK